MSTPRTHPAGISTRAVLLLALFVAASDPHADLLVGEAGAQSWSPVIPSGPPPGLRRQQGMVVDEVGHRLVVVGGENTDGSTWALNLTGPPSWVNLNAPAPEGNDVVHAVYDRVGRRVILLTPSMAVYALDLANPAWTQLAVSGSGPSPRGYPAVAYDSFRNRLLVFGGLSFGTTSDVWALDLSGPAVWRQLAATGLGPSPRWGAAALYDPVGDRLVVTTGASIEGAFLNDLWALPLVDPPAWVRILPIGPLPPARFLSAIGYDPGTKQLVLFGGYNGAGLNDLWGIELENPGAWIQFHPPDPLPPPRWSHRMSFDAAMYRMITYGGWDGTSFRGDLWALSTPDPEAPPQVYGFSPLGGRAGDIVEIHGVGFIEPVTVDIGGAPAEVLSFTFGTIRATVPSSAVTGPIKVTTPIGTATSPSSFVVGKLPQITDVEPDSARVGELVEIRGRFFERTNRVRFGGTGSASFSVLSDTVLAAMVDIQATTGPIEVTTVIGTNRSAFGFEVIPDDPRPRLLSVRDVVGDQGGRVMLRWRASDFDQSRYRSITGYRVWRRAPLEGASEDARVSAELRTSRALALTPGDPSVFWEPLVDLPAAFLSGYAYAAATLQDSTEFGNPYTAFFVQAITGSPFVFYNSSPDSGYSVDNLAPPAPSPFAVNYGQTANTLHWRGRELRDLRGYEIHRGTDADFTPSPANLVATTRETTYVDLSGSHFYKIAALDMHGNRSRYVAATPDQPVATIATFSRSFRERGLARVVWHSGGNPSLSANVYRRTEDTGWESVGRVFADGRGLLTFEDRTVEDVIRYGYRLGIVEPEQTEEMMAETWVEPLAEAFAFAGRIANPSMGGRISCSVVVPPGERADLHLFDVSGREVERRRLEAGGTPERTVEFGVSRRLRAGVYLLRARSSRTAMTARVVVLD